MDRASNAGAGDGDGADGEAGIDEEADIRAFRGALGAVWRSPE
jgi:hypothetical protein